MKPVDVKSNTYINSSKEMNDKNPKFKPNLGGGRGANFTLPPVSFPLITQKR